MDYLIGQTFSITAITAFVFFCFGYIISYLFEKTKIKEESQINQTPVYGDVSSRKEECFTRVEVKEVPIEKVVIKEIIQEVPVERVVVKEIIKEVEIEKSVERKVPAERVVVKEIPIEKVVIKEIIREVPVEKVVIKEVIKEVEVEKIIEKEVPIEHIVEKVVVKEVPVAPKTKEDDLSSEEIAIIEEERKKKEERKDNLKVFLQKLSDEYGNNNANRAGNKALNEDEEIPLYQDGPIDIPELSSSTADEYIEEVEQTKKRDIEASKTIRDFKPKGDDLTELWGLGKSSEKLLNEQGIYTFEQLAELARKPRKRKKIASLVPFGKFYREAWMIQAEKKIPKKGKKNTS